jgi:phosphate transport system substrate-binding protein
MGPPPTSKRRGVGLDYQAIGSDGGIKQIKTKTVTFGASDMPLALEELNRSGLLQFPMIMGGVVLVVNLKGIGPGVVTLDGPTLAENILGGHCQVERSKNQVTERHG